MGNLKPDYEGDAYITNSFSGDQNDDGLKFITPINDTSTTLVTDLYVNNPANSVANLYAWIDLNRNGYFEAIELQTTTIPANSLDQVLSLNWTGISGIVNGQDYYLRVRLTTDALTDDPGTTNHDERSLGLANDGEIEDYLIRSGPYDMGDLPDSYKTLLTTKGAYHTQDTQLFIGTTTTATNEWDAEADASTSSGANGDDTTGTDDEGDNPGSILALPIPLSGSDYSINVKVYARTKATLIAWLDINKDGQFTTDEASTTNTSINSTTIQTLVLNWTGLDKSTLADGDNLALRVRLSSQRLTNNDWAGPAPDGEVEDHMILVGNFDYGDALIPQQAPQPITTRPCSRTMAPITGLILIST